MIGLYHSADLDGKCCGAIMRYKYPDIKLIGYDYGQIFPWEAIEGQDVIMADVSIEPFSQMIELKNRCKSFKWFDHHKTVIEHLDESGVIFDGTQAEGLAGCELLWAYLFPTVDMPRAVHLLGRYDVWDHKDEDVLPFQFGMRMEDNNPDNQRLWKWLFEYQTSPNFLIKIIENGKTIIKYQEQQDAGLAKSMAFTTELEGIPCIAVNSYISSDTLKTVYNPDLHDAMVGFVWKDGKWKFSLRTVKDGIDILSIAKFFGGGGHPKACGFVVETIPAGLLP